MIQPPLRSGQTSNLIEVTMHIDSVSEANCMRMEDFIKIQNRPDLKKTRAILKAYNGERVFPKGEIYLDIQIGGKITRAKFLVIDDAPSSLLSGKTCEERKTEMPNFYGMLSKFADFCCFHRHIENEATTMQRNRSAHTACGRLTSHAHINSENGRPQLTFKIVLVLTCL